MMYNSWWKKNGREVGSKVNTIHSLKCSCFWTVFLTLAPSLCSKTCPQVCPKADLDPTKASALNVVNIGGVFVVGEIVRQLLRFLIIKTQQVYVLVSVNSQLSIKGVGLNKPTTSLNPTSKHTSHLRKPSKGVK